MGTGTKLDGISQPQFPHFATTKLEGPFPGAQDVQGVTREYVEWRTVLTAEKAGVIDIPAIAALFKVPASRRHTSMFGFPSFFDDPFQQKQIYSNALQITVKPLPESKQQKNCFGVGSFALALIALERSQAKEGEGVVLKVSIVGKGAIMRFPILTLPDGLQYYESKQYIDGKASSPHGDTHVFEYIVQGTQSGTYKIARQAFTFFDPAHEQYKQVHTDQSLSLAITPLLKGAAPSPAVDGKTSTIKHTNEPKAVPVDNPYAEYLITDWHTTQSASIPPLVYSGLLLLCLLFLLTRYAIATYRWYAHKNSDRWRVQRAGSRSIKRLNEAEKKGATAQIYPIVIDFFAERLGVSGEVIDENYIANLFAQRVSLQNQIQSWHDFYQLMAYAKYGGHTHAQEAKHLFQEAKKWISFLDGSL